MAQVKGYQSPWSETIGDETIHFRMMSSSDANRALAFANTLPESDLIFLRLDITQPDVVDAWARNIEAGRTTTILAEVDGSMVGYGSLHRDDQHWTRHQGEVRLMVLPRYRGKGLGKIILQALCGLGKELGLDRLIAQIPADQPRVRDMIATLGFRPAALLTDWLKDRNGRKHDLVIMSRDL